LPLPLDRDESIHQYIPMPVEKRKQLLEEASNRKVFTYKNLQNPPDYVFGLNYSIAKDYIHRKLHLFMRNPLGRIGLIHLFSYSPSMFIEHQEAKRHLEREVRIGNVPNTKDHLQEVIGDGNCLFSAFALHFMINEHYKIKFEKNYPKS
jgi:hypothetical protein